MALCGYYGTGYSGSAPSETQTGITGRPYVPLGTARPVLWFHSAGSGSSQEPWLGANSTTPILEAIAALGLPILSADCSGAAHWGNDTAQSRVTDMRSSVQSNAYLKASSAKAILMGVSMGGLLALNWARANPTLVQAIVLFYPCVNLQAQHDGTGGATASTAGTEAAYGGSLAAFNAAVVAHDPAQHATDFQQFPIQMHYSDSDVVVGSANQAAFISSVGGSNLETHVLAGAAHADMTRIDTGLLATFLGAHA